MPRAILYRQEQVNRWVHTHVWKVPVRRALLLESCPGDERWIHAVPERYFPRWAAPGAKRRKYKTYLRDTARRILADPISYDLALRADEEV